MSFDPNVTPTKITYEGDTLLDLTGDTVTADKLANGYTAHNSAGQAITGTMASVTVNSLSVTENGTYTAPSGTAYSPVTVNVSGGGGGNILPRAGVNASGATTRIATVDASNLISVSNNHLYYWMYYNTSLTSVNLSNLVTVNGNGLRGAFYQCSALTTVDLSSLTTIAATGLDSAFRGCSALTSISFPSLTSVVASSLGANCFNGCTNLTAMHFRADMSSTIQGLTGYSSKFGATNATIYFDL